MRLNNPDANANSGDRDDSPSLSRRELLRATALGSCALLGARVFASADSSVQPLHLTTTAATKPFALTSMKIAPRFAGSYALSGPLRAQIQGVIDHWLLLAPENNPAMLGMFQEHDKAPHDLLPWSGEFAGKYLTACSEIIRLTHDAALLAHTQRFVDRLVSLQMDDGYLGPWAQQYRFVAVPPGENWDAWSHYHLMLGLLLWHDETGDAKALRCAQKIGDLVCNRFLGGGHHVADMANPDQNQAIIHGLCLLYEKTGTGRYFELAQQIVGEFELPGSGDYLRTALAGQEFYATPRPRWESLHAILGLAEMYRLTGKDDYRQAFEHIWWSIVKLDRHNNGGFSSGEQATGNPYNPAPIETCCTIAWLALSVEMLRLTGNSIVADEIELSTLNSVVGLHSPNGEWSTYNTPMDGRRIPNTQDISFQIRPGSQQLNCCSVNAARGFGFIGDWGLMTEAGENATSPTLVLNWYGPSVLSVPVNGTDIVLRQETTYPREGHIVLHVEPARPQTFTLKLRIPYWSKKTTVRVNGVETSVEPGTYCALSRHWKRGDKITLDMDMRLRAWAGEKEASGKVSLYRGPLLLAYEQTSSAIHQRPGQWHNFGELFASHDQGTAFEYDFEGEGIKWFGRLYDDAGQARVLIDGKLVAVVDQYGPVRDAPFSWEHGGLAPGKHTIRIEVSGDKPPASRDTWSNVVGFGAPGSSSPQASNGLEPLDLKTVKAHLVSPPAGTTPSLLWVEVSDASGKTVPLRDFGLAGQQGALYSTWLLAQNAPAAPFSHNNPLRSIVLE